MKKKITMLLLLAFVVLAVCPAAASSFTDLAQTPYEHAISELEALHIINGYEDGTFRPDNELTRAEFCSLMINTMGLEELAAAPAETGFADVPASHWASGCIKLAYDMGVINGYGDGYFGPEDKVTYVQTLKMLLNAMGYAPLAEDNGGYPTGYMVVGGSRISSGVSKAADAAITRGEAAQLIYNALDVNIVESDYSQEGGYKINYDKTLLTELLSRRGLEKMEGIVTGDSHTRLNSEAGVSDGWLEINGVSYYLDGRSPYGLLGRSVTYYVQENTGTANEPALYGIWVNTAKNEELAISPKNVAGIEGNEITYFAQADSNRARSAKLAGNPITIFNGVYLDGGPDDWKVENGQMTLLDNNGDDVYEVVFVDTYTTYMVDKVDTEKQQIDLRVFSDTGESRYQGKTCIEYGYPDVEVAAQDMEGEPIAFTDLQPYDIIAVYAGVDESHITIVRAEGTVEGTVDEVTEDVMVIDGTSYDIAVNNAGQLLVTAQPGEQGRFWLDVDGRVTAKNVVSGSDYAEQVETIDEEVVCSYILDTAVTRNGLDDVVQLKVLSNLRNKQREERIFSLAEQVEVDGAEMNPVEALNLLTSLGDGSPNIPIRYDLNSRDEIDEIGTFTLATPAGYREYSEDTNSFDGMYFITSDSIVYYVDYADKEKVYSNIEVTLGDGMPYNMKVYDPVGMEFTAENRIFIIYVNLETVKSPETDPDKPLLVTSTSEYMDDDGDVRMRVTGYVDGELVTFDLSENAQKKESRIAVGALLRVTKNALGEMDDLRLLAQLPPEEEHRIGVGGENEQTYGQALSIKSNSRYTSVILEVGYPKNGKDQSVSYEIADCPVYVYDDKRSEIEIGTTNDIVTAQYAGDNASMVFVSVVNFNPVAVVVIK